MSTGIAMPSNSEARLSGKPRRLGVFEVVRRIYQSNGSDRRSRDVKLSLCA